MPDILCSGMSIEDVAEETIRAKSVDDAISKVKDGMPKKWEYICTKDIELMCILSD